MRLVPKSTLSSAPLGPTPPAPLPAGRGECVSGEPRPSFSPSPTGREGGMRLFSSSRSLTHTPRGRCS
jgi:hypothetical protein